MDSTALRSFGSGSPLFAGQPEPPMTFDFNAMGSNPMLSMLGNAGIGQLFGGAGLMPGQFFPTQNIYDQAQARQYWASRQRAMSVAGEADQDTYTGMLRGVARMTGQPYGIQQERAARTLASGVSTIAPFLQSMLGPEMFDTIHGSRGSASVMAQYLHGGGRQAIDPVTGQSGLSGESAGALASMMQRSYFSDNTGLVDFHGLSSGRAGMLFDAMQGRGLVGGGMGGLSDAERHRVLMADVRPMNSALDALRQSDPDRFKRVEDYHNRNIGSAKSGYLRAIKEEAPDEYNKLVRDVDARKYTDSIKKLSGSVAAMRDIFGDAGRPNAPMRELLEGLDQLTQGGLVTMDRGKLEKSVRGTQALAKITGVGMDAMMGLMSRGAGLADQMGLARPFAVQATQGAVAFGSAYSQTTQVGRDGKMFSLAETPHWQSRSVEQLTLTDQQLRLSAARSGDANQLATTVRMVENLEQQGIDVQGPAALIAKAVRDRKPTYRDPETGKETSIFQTESDWQKSMEKSGFSIAATTRAARQTDANQQTTANHRVQDLVRIRQGDDLIPIYSGAQAPVIADLLRSRGVDDPNNTKALAASDAISRAMREGRVTNDDGTSFAFNRNADKERNQVLSSLLRDTLAKQGVNGIDQRDLVNTVASGLASYHQTIMNDPNLRGLGGGINSFNVHDQSVLQNADKKLEDANATGLLRSSLAGLGQAGPLARLSDAIQLPAKDRNDFIGKIFGGVSPSEVHSRLSTAGSLSDAELAGAGISNRDRITAMGGELTTAARQFEDARALKDPTARTNAMTAANADVEALTAGGSKATDRISQMLKARRLTADQIDAVLKSNGNLGGFSLDDVKRLQALKLAEAKGLTASATDAGIGKSQSTGVRDSEEALSFSARMSGARSRGDHAEALRTADLLHSKRNEIADNLAVDPDAIASLGKGGVKLTTGLRDKQIALEAIALKRGVSVAQLMASDDPESRALVEGARGDMVEIHRRQSLTHGEMPVMDAEEKKQANAYRESLVKSDSDQNRKLIDRLARSTGGEKLSEDERKELAGKLGSGRDAEVARFELGQQIKARESIDFMVLSKGGDPAAVRESLRAGKSATAASGLGLSSDETKEFEANAKRAGKLLRAGDDGVNAKSYGDSVAGLVAKPATPVAGNSTAAAGGPTKIVGTLTIDGNTGTLFGTATPGGMGSVPVPGP